VYKAEATNYASKYIFDTIRQGVTPYTIRSLSVASSLNVIGAMSISGQFIAYGNISASSTLTVAGTISASSSLSVLGIFDYSNMGPRTASTVTSEFAGLAQPVPTGITVVITDGNCSLQVQDSGSTWRTIGDGMIISNGTNARVYFSASGTTSFIKLT
jgi:hypothetical protein